MLTKVHYTDRIRVVEILTLTLGLELSPYGVSMTPKPRSGSLISLNVFKKLKGPIDFQHKYDTVSQNSHFIVIPNFLLQVRN